MAELVSEFARNADRTEHPPPVEARFFFNSPYAIDDPLSPLPPPNTTAKPGYQQPPRPFSSFDNDALEEAWLKLRKEIQRVTKVEASIPSRGGKDGSEPQPIQTNIEKRAKEIIAAQRQTRGGLSTSHGSASGESTPSSSMRERGSSLSAGGQGTVPNPFIRAPLRKKLDVLKDERSTSRPPVQSMDSYDWDDEVHPPATAPLQPATIEKKSTGPEERVAVGVSRLHEVVMPALQMDPIYWSPLNDRAPVIRATWFYKESMFPVEADVANMLEAGYVALQPWTQTWKDELNSAVDVGAIGEEKILHKLWPDKAPSRPTTARGSDSVSNVALDTPDPEKERQGTVTTAVAIIDTATGTLDVDNKASGTTTYGRDGRVRLHPQSGVIYVDKREAYLLRPNLQPSDYYGRKPLASYIRKGRDIGVPVVRGFNQADWDKLHPSKEAAKVARVMGGTSSAEAGAPPSTRQKLDPRFSLSERPAVTDLVLVIHGIGQKLSEKVESYHFTFAMNAFRREINVELGSDTVKPNLRKGMGGIMVLPVNWRLGLSFEDGGYRDGAETSVTNQYSLNDITPDTLPSVRSVVGDVMLDIPYYLSQEHNPKMVNACIKEANRIYHLWCANNPGFARYGRVHLIAHSLGSVMAFDILSNQPTHVDHSLVDGLSSKSDVPTDHFLFDTSSLFTIGSPIGFFLLLRRAALLPRKGHQKAGTDNTIPTSPGVTGEQGQFGCLAIDNIYNVINGYDPIAYRVNAAFDSTYSNSLKKAFLPSASSGYRFTNPFSRAPDPVAPSSHPPMPRLPSNVELETHNFTREEIAEERAYLLNDNGQVDWYMRYGGGPLEIQYLTMLSAHSSYWLSRDFVRMIVTEVGRTPGREGTLTTMRAVKKKAGEK